MDDSYQAYVNRVARMTLPDAYQAQARHLQASPKFSKTDDRISVVPFPGYSVITPPGESDIDNTDLYKTIAELQQNLVQKLPDGAFAAVPASSFHMTLADLIWNAAYQQAIATHPDYEQRLRNCIAASFQNCEQSIAVPEPLSLQVLGLMLMPRAIALCLAPKAEQTYRRLTDFRRAIYQNPDMMALGIEQQYHFTGHITLGYFINPAVLPEPEQLSDRLTSLNQQWQDSEAGYELTVTRAELCKFDDMTRYYRETGWPVLSFQPH